MKKTIVCNLFLVAMAVTAFVGCSDRVAVTGTVTYADGSPLQVGQVVFTDGKFAFRGPIDKKGAYKLGGTKSGDGIIPGQYSVYLIDTDTTESTESGGTRFVSFVARKFTSPETSELTCEIKGKMTFDFKVERP